MKQKRNTTRDIFAASSRERRQSEIDLHGRPTAFRTRVRGTQKRYDRNRTKRMFREEETC